ncbi:MULTISPECIES: hypothetical protein [Kordiimonadales]|uniref:Uncharacterized protein n=1 Tax=Gimibacter soli TaxID=3024400 RepID=A0AAF0BJK9_9PROT|nr:MULTISPECIES: hypothetical protein [Kordiimonadales]WCL53234.1 hypothetical protein PH603_11880 [Gimibacter soli]
MIDALNIAANGLIQSEKRATDVARKIIDDTTAAANFSLDDLPEGANTAAVATATGGSGKLSGGPGFGDLIQHMVDLKTEKHVFAANAKVFSSIDETLDEGLGRLLDDKG